MKLLQSQPTTEHELNRFRALEPIFRSKNARLHPFGETARVRVNAWITRGSPRCCQCSSCSCEDWRLSETRGVLCRCPSVQHLKGSP